MAGTVSYWVLTMSTLGAVFPALGRGETVPAIALSSVGVWVFHFLVLRGVHGAAAINRIVTIAKMVPIAVFIVVGLVMFKSGVFAGNFWGGTDRSFAAVFAQAKGTMLITVFVFLGIEGASVYSRYARKRSDIGRATVLGFVSVLSVVPGRNLRGLLRPGANLEAGQFGGSVEQQPARFPDRAAQPATEMLEIGVDVAPLPRQRHRQHVRRQMGPVAVQLDLVPA